MRRSPEKSKLPDHAGDLLNLTHNTLLFVVVISGAQSLPEFVTLTVKPQNPKVMKPPKLTELTEHFGLSEAFIAKKCRKWYGGGDHPHDARYDAAAAYLCMLVGEEMA